MGEIPEPELAEILEKRCAIAPSYAAKLVAVMRELERRRQVLWPVTAGLLACLPAEDESPAGRWSLAHASHWTVQLLALSSSSSSSSSSSIHRRAHAHADTHTHTHLNDCMCAVQASNVFAGKRGLITPRDLFRWADRKAGSYLELAQHGFMLLAERLRSPGEAAAVQDTLQRIMRVQVWCWLHQPQQLRCCCCCCLHNMASCYWQSACAAREKLLLYKTSCSTFARAGVRTLQASVLLTVHALVAVNGIPATAEAALLRFAASMCGGRCAAHSAACSQAWAPNGILERRRSLYRGSLTASALCFVHFVQTLACVSHLDMLTVYAAGGVRDMRAGVLPIQPAEAQDSSQATC